MKGDMSEPFLGLSEDDQKLLHETVEIVFHSAATVRFDEELRYRAPGYFVWYHVAYATVLTNFLMMRVQRF